TLEDFRDQLKQVRQLGPLDQILGMLPLGKMLKGAPKDLEGESADLDRFDAIISSMTPGERHNPELINGSRRQRIARGSGTNVQDVNRLVTPLTDHPQRFENITDCVLWDRARDTRERRRITGARRQGAAVLVTLAGCETVEAAGALVGHFLALPEGEALPLPPGSFYPWQL